MLRTLRSWIRVAVCSVVATVCAGHGAAQVIDWGWYHEDYEVQGESRNAFGAWPWDNVGVQPYFECSWSEEFGFFTRLFPATITTPSVLSVWYDGTVGARFQWHRGVLDVAPPTRFLARVFSEVRGRAPEGYSILLRNGLDSDQVFDAPNQEWVSSGSRTLLLDVPAGPSPSVTVAPIHSYANGVGHTSVGGPLAWSRVKIVPLTLPSIRPVSLATTYFRSQTGDRVANEPDTDGQIAADTVLTYFNELGFSYRGNVLLQICDSPWEDHDTRACWQIFPQPSMTPDASTLSSLPACNSVQGIGFYVSGEDQLPAYEGAMYVAATVTSKRMERNAPSVPTKMLLRFHYPIERWFEWRSRIDQGTVWPVSCDEPAYYHGVAQATWSEDNAFWFVMDQRGRPVLQSAFDMLSFIPNYRLLSKIVGFLLEAPWTKSYTQGVAFTTELFNSPLSYKHDQAGNPVSGSYPPEEFTMMPGLWIEHRHHFFEGEEYDVHGYVGQTRRQPAVKFAQQWFGDFTLTYRVPAPANIVLEEE